MKTVTIYMEWKGTVDRTYRYKYGGYGAILTYKGHEKEISGGEVNLANNHDTLLMGTSAALEALKEPCKVNLLLPYEMSAKQYNDMKNGLELNRWLNYCEQNIHWIDCPDDDLWQRLSNAAKTHTIKLPLAKDDTECALRKKAKELTYKAEKDTFREKAVCIKCMRCHTTNINFSCPVWS